MKATGALMKKAKKEAERKLKSQAKTNQELLMPPPLSPLASPKKIKIGPSTFLSPTKMGTVKQNVEKSLPAKMTLFPENLSDNGVPEVNAAEPTTAPKQSPKKRKVDVDDVDLATIFFKEYQPNSNSQLSSEDEQQNNSSVISEYDNSNSNTYNQISRNIQAQSSNLFSPSKSPGYNASNTSKDGYEQQRHKSSKFTCTKARKKEIGNWGEELVYKKLKASYPQAETVWHNNPTEMGEQGLPYDISQSQVNLNNTKFYEVKTTVDAPTSKTKKASFSARQVATMEKEKSNYAIVRVYNAEKKNAKLTTINDPYQKIFHPKRNDVNNRVITYVPSIPVKSFKLKI